MSENITNCPHCKEHCPLTNPGCGRGERLAREQRGETVVNEGTRERGEHEGHRRGEHNPEGRGSREERHGEHGGHGHHAETDTLEGLFRACGHKLHHGGEEANVLFGVLTPEEREYLQAILKKIIDK